MKRATKAIVFVVLVVPLKIVASLPLAAMLARGFGRAVVTYGIPLAKKAGMVAKPYYAKAEQWALENPEKAAWGVGGGLLGYGSAESNILDRSVETVLGVSGGLFLGGVRVARAAQLGLEVQLAKTTEKVALLELRNAEIGLALEAEKQKGKVAVQRLTELHSRDVKNGIGQSRKIARLQEELNAAKTASLGAFIKQRISSQYEQVTEGMRVVAGALRVLSKGVAVER